MMILFGGGDGGGISIGQDGKLHRIPPWTPDVMAALKAAGAVLKASIHVESALGAELKAVGEKLTTSVIPRLAKTAEATGGGAVLFLDGDDGFTCGTGGGHPIPVPIPHGAISSFR